MKSSRSIEIVLKGTKSARRVPRDGSGLPPWIFKNQDLENALESAETVDKNTLANTINHIHFMDGSLFVHLRHPRYEESILVRAYPEPCIAKEITCRWSNEDLMSIDLKKYQFMHIIIDDGRSVILAPALLKEINKDFLKVELPETSYAVGQRQTKRHTCRDVITELIQSGFHGRGELLDFSPAGFRVRVKADPSCSFHWFNSDELVTIHLRKDQQMLFSGLCRCIRQRGKLQDREIVLVPVDERIKRFKKKSLRNLRQQLVPSPNFVFIHPFLNKRTEFKGYDISTSGFSVYEETEKSVLLPGMIIPEMTINFVGGLKIECAAQVIYRLDEEEDRDVRYGFSILDMDINAYSRLTHILTNALDPHAYISNEVDMDALWEFFFDTGFIYPAKYRLIQSHRDEFKETYRKLYQECPEISRHFTSQKNGRVYGHMSMLRVYERTWLIHHHAARAMDSKRTGFMVLKQIVHYMNDMYRLPSAQIDYVMCYFQPKNKFPDRVFGNFARSLDNPRGCSMDLFAFLLYTSLSLGTQLPEGWSLGECSAHDIWELNRFYVHSSGGLLLDSMGLAEQQEAPMDKSLEELYRRLGFTREWQIYSLAFRGELAAVLILDYSDLGINLSELLNCIKVLVINQEGLPWNVLSVAISQLAGEYNMDRVPVMFYPFEYVQDNNVPCEKQYQLWIYDVHFVDRFMEHLQKRFRIKYK
ncbi:MAG: hypothetical protein JRC68_08655 [Deltaproteobacteria bacterium]|nr:hypothetical protein [Deltaproteobacteria bacterium]